MWIVSVFPSTLCGPSPRHKNPLNALYVVHVTVDPVVERTLIALRRFGGLHTLDA